MLPFQNMSGDPEQEYFADGVIEDIITGLSRFNELFVIARNSSFTYKGKAVDIKQVGAELGVRYVLEGSVRKAAEPAARYRPAHRRRHRHHLWADRYDRRPRGRLRGSGGADESIVARSRHMASEIEAAKARRRRLSLNAYDIAIARYGQSLGALHQVRSRLARRRQLGSAAGLEIDADKYARLERACWAVLNIQLPDFRRPKIGVRRTGRRRGEAIELDRIGIRTFGPGSLRARAGCKPTRRSAGERAAWL